MGALVRLRQLDRILEARRVLLFERSNNSGML